MTEFKLLDIIDPDDIIEIKIRHDGEVVWVNIGHKCVLRICGIDQDIIVDDSRNDKYVEPMSKAKKLRKLRRK